MSYQPSPSQQGTYPAILVQAVDEENGDFQLFYERPYYSAVFPPSQGTLDAAAAYHHHALQRTGVDHHYSPLQGPHRPRVIPQQLPTPSLPIPIPTQYDATIESSPSPSPSTPGSTSSSASVSNPEVCRQSEPLFDWHTQRWCCGGCNRAFSDKYGVQRHIATIGVKVTCRYCGSRISALESSRRRHLRREACRRLASDRGFTTRNEEDAFIADPWPVPSPEGFFDNPSVY